MSERVANPPQSSFTHNGPRLLESWKSVHNLQPPRHRSLERKDRDWLFLASEVMLFGGLFSATFSADRLPVGCGRTACSMSVGTMTRDPDHIISHSGAGVGRRCRCEYNA